MRADHYETRTETQSHWVEIQVANGFDGNGTPMFRNVYQNIPSTTSYQVLVHDAESSGASSSSSGASSSGGSNVTSGGYAAPPSYNAGPSQEQLAAQREAQRRRERLNAAHNKNEQGVSSYNRKDWAAAVTFFRQARDNNPGDRTIRTNLERAQEQLDAQHREEDRKRADTATANDMKAAIDQITSAMPVATVENSVAPGSQMPGAGLEFMPAGGDADRSSTSDAFGTKKSHPTLQFGDPNAAAVGTNTKAVDQLTSIAHNERSQKPPGATAESAEVNAGLGFDTGVKKDGSLSAIKVETPAGVSELPEITPAMAKDPIVQQDLNNYNQWKPQLQKAQEEVKQAQAAMEKAPDAGARAVANTALIAAKGKSDGLRIAVESAKKEIEDRKIHIEKFAVTGGASPAPSPAQ